MTSRRPSAHARVLLLAAAFLVPSSGCRGAPSPAPAPAPEHEHEHGPPTNLPPVGASVALKLDGSSKTVDLAALARDGGASSVPLTELWRAAFPAEDLSRLHFDFVGSDGFRSTSRPKCAKPLSGDELARGRMDLNTHDLSFDEALKLPGCYRVRAVVSMDGAR